MPRMKVVRMLVVAAAVVAVSAVVMMAAAPTSQPQSSTTSTSAASSSASESRGDARFAVRVTPEMIRHSRIADILYFTGTFYSIAVLLLLLATRVSARLRDAAARVAKRPLLTASLFFILLSLVTTLLEFPLSYYGGFVVPHQFDLTNQSFGAWLGDFGKAVAVDLVIGALLAPLVLFAMRRFKRWWLPLWLGSIPLMIVGVVVWPVFVDPLFNKFEPLHDQVLRARLLDTASRAGIEGSRVYEVDKSKQTKTMNAYVTGVGPTKRIVLWDTLLQKLTHDEIVVVMGHEMGHYVLNHLWKGLAFSVLVSLLVTFLGQRAFDGGLARWGSRWQVRDAGDPAALPWLLVITSTILFVLSPIVSSFSRWEEHQADIFGLELTHLNAPMASAFVKFAEDSKQNPRPNAFIEFWRYSHPSLGRRIDFVLGYHPWTEGKPNELWTPERKE